MKKVNRKRMNDETGHNIWRSYSDMMSGLLLLFVLIMAVCLMQAQKNYRDRLAEQATRVQTQTELELTQDELSRRESELEEKDASLSSMQAALAQQQSELQQNQEQLKSRESELQASQEQVSQQQSEIDATAAQIAQQESELASRDEALAQSQQNLDEANALMKTQQEKIDQIIGVKADLIAALNQEFRNNQIDVNIDSQTGAIVLNSSVLFDLNESVLTDDGKKVLHEVLPTYCQVLLSDAYSDYVAEVIIDGYTDSSGSYISNLQLSQARAYAVAEYLLQTSGDFLSSEQNEALAQKLTANGRSQSDLILDASGNENAEASRRVEIKFRLKDEEMISELSQIISDTQNAETETGSAAQGGS